MNAQEIALAAKCTVRHAYYFLAGHGFSKSRAERLEVKTGKHRLFWMYPGQYDERGRPVSTERGRPPKSDPTKAA